MFSREDAAAFINRSRASAGCGFVFGYLPLLNTIGRLEANLAIPLRDGQGWVDHDGSNALNGTFTPVKIGLAWTVDGATKLLQL